AAALTCLSLSSTVGKAVLAGLFTSSKPFLRTPKCEGKAPWTHALRIAAFDAAMLAGTVIAIVKTIASGKTDDPAQIAWVAGLFVLSVPYASAVLVALGSTLQLGGSVEPVPADPELAPAYASTSKMDMAA